MMNLATTTDKFQLTTSVATNVDVYASFVDLNGTTVTPGKQLTAITTATTTDIVAAPASSTFRNIKHLTIRNKGNSATDITIIFDANGTDYEIFKTNLSPGDNLVHYEEAGFIVVPAIANRKNVSTADQSLTATTDTVVTNSSLSAVGLKAGAILRWTVDMDKTAAGTAAHTFAVAFGTAGTTADTIRIGTSSAFTTGTQTAAADVAKVILQAVIRTVSATGSCHGEFFMSHNLSATGFATIPNVVIQQTPATFDMTTAGLLATLRTTSGTGSTTTIHQCIAERIDP